MPEILHILERFWDPILLKSRSWAPGTPNTDLWGAVLEGLGTILERSWDQFSSGFGIRLGIYLKPRCLATPSIIACQLLVSALALTMISSLSIPKLRIVP